MTGAADSIFHEARRRPAGDARAAYLDGACGEDAPLRAKVEALLKADADAGSFLRSAADEDAEFDLDATIPQSADAGRAVRRAQPAESPGQMIGRYKLLKELGEGGFGVVYMAEQDQPVRRRVALKIIKLGMDTRQVMARFEAERQALAMMDHTNIARVYDAGATASGRPYFVMELVRGVPISEYCDAHSLTLRQRLDLFIPVCQAIHHAHQKGVIHRDIKPSNVLVTTQDDRPVAKVIDFGIAKATNLDLTDKTLFTAHKQMIGTPAYMSPEQASSSPDIDTRTDIYSLGVLLYELLTGTTPFDSARLRSAGLAGIQRILTEEEPRKPSTRLSELARGTASGGKDSRASASGPGVRRDSRTSDEGTPEFEDGVAEGATPSTSLEEIARHRRTDPAALRKVLRGDLDWIVMKCLERDRRRRYESANSLAVDIERHLQHQPVLAGAPGAAYRLRKFVRRNRAGVIAGTLLAAALVLGVIGTSGGLLWALNEKSLAAEQATKARVAADIAERAAYQAQMMSAAKAVEDQRMDAASALLAATPPRLRGWEYQHVLSRLDRSLPSPFLAEWRISHLSRAAATGRVAVLRTDQQGSTSWVVLDSDLRTERFILPGTEAGNLVLSPDGTRALWTPQNAGDERPAALWNLDTNSLQTILPIRPIQGVRNVLLATWSPTGDRFVISREDEFEVHDGRTGSLLERRKAEGVALFTTDGRWMLLCGTRQSSDFDARAMRLLDARTFEPQPDVVRFGSAVGAYGVSFWGSRVGCALEGGTLQILDIEDGVLRPRFKVAPGIGVLTTPAWSPDGRLIAVGTADGRVGVWETDSQTPRGEFAGSQAAISGLLFLSDSGDLWMCDLEGHHRVWPIRSGSASVLTGHKSFVYPAVLSKDGAMLVSGGWDGAVGYGGGLKLWDARTGTLVAEYGQPNEIVWSADLTPDNRYAVAGYWAETPSLLRTDVIDLWSGRVKVTFPSGANQATPVCVVHPDGRRVVTSFPTGATYVWDLLNGKVLWEFLDPAVRDPSKGHASAVAVASDGHVLALTERDRGIRLVNADSYADIRRWDAHADMIWSLSFSADGKQLLSTSLDDTIGVWDVATGALLARLVGHNADVFCAAMSPDGTRIASGGRDRYVRLWDTTHFENVAQLGGHKDYIYSLAWSPDGQQLFSSSGDGTLRVWDTRTLAEQLAAARARSDALPGIEARVAKTRANAPDPAPALEALLAAPQLGTRERELARQVVARFALQGAPAYYRAPRASTAIVIDGKLDEPAWRDAAWSEPFVDIEGEVRPKPRFETRVRMCWDDANLYVAARLEEPHIWATLRNRDDFVLNDNDFEVFVDPEGDARWYGEVEVNALGTLFDLRLERSYLEGGPAHHEWSPPEMRAAASIDGTLNDPSDTDRGWTVEIAIPHTALADHAAAPLPPRPGDVWRINFSRVEWQHDVVDGHYARRPETREDNWVWSPQHVINMHVPQRWGFVEFLPEEH